MRALCWATSFAVLFGSQAFAQFPTGTVAITNHVNGVPITVSATSWINAIESERASDARIFIDLIDLQRKFPAVIDGLRTSAADCAKRDSESLSPTVSLKSGSLLPVDDQLIISLRGQVDLWSCKPRSGKSSIIWKKQKIGFLNIKLPTRQTVNPGMKKTKDGTQSFRGNLPIQLVQKDRMGVALKISDPEIRLEGQDVLVTRASLDHAKMDINQKMYAALLSAINFVKLKTMLPKELQQSAIVSARFRSQGGHAIAEINLAGMRQARSEAQSAE